MMMIIINDVRRGIYEVALCSSRHPLVLSGLASNDYKEYQREGHGNHAKYEGRCDHNLLIARGVRILSQKMLRRMRRMQWLEEREEGKNTGLLS
jgi:hypothetical protein